MTEPMTILNLIDEVINDELIWYPITPARCRELAEGYSSSHLVHHKRLAEFYAQIPRKIIISPDKRGTPDYVKAIFDHELED